MRNTACCIKIPAGGNFTPLHCLINVTEVCDKGAPVQNIHVSFDVFDEELGTCCPVILLNIVPHGSYWIYTRTNERKSFTTLRYPDVIFTWEAHNYPSNLDHSEIKHFLFWFL